MLKYILFVSGVLFFTGCKDKNEMFSDITTEVISKDGVEVPLYDFESFEHLLNINDGKVRVINFWATWCKPCVEELPYFELINSKYVNKDVEVILVSLDIPLEIESKLIPFLLKQRIESKVLLLDDPDANSWIPKINKNWSGSIPATLIYKGTTKHFYERSFTYYELEKELKGFLK